MRVDRRARLTKRQRTILRLLAEGRSTAEIASELTLSRATVRNHIAAVIAALGVHTRLQAVMAAQAAGLLPSKAGEGRSAAYAPARNL